LADEKGLDEERARAEQELAHVEGISLSHRMEGEKWLARARATLSRIGGDAAAEAELDAIGGWIDYKANDYLPALALFQRSLARHEAFHLPTNQTQHGGISAVLVVLERFDEAIAHAQEAMRIVEREVGPQHRSFVITLTDLSEVEVEAGRVEEALADARRAVAVIDSAVQRGELAPQSHNVGFANEALGKALLRADRPAEAAETFVRVADIYRATHGSESTTLAYTEAYLGEALREVGRLKDAERAWSEARTIADRAKDMPSDVMALVYTLGASLAIERHRTDEATALAERAVGGVDTAPVFDRATARVTLARALSSQGGNRERIRSLAEQARDDFERVRQPRRANEAAALARTAAE
jgi:tetratricopeptide (TPR) repeat protein